MNAELRQKAKNNFQKDLFKLKNFPALNLSQQRRRNYLAPEPNYYTTKFFTENVLVKEMKKKNQVAINNPVCLGLSILHLSNTVMYEFWYDYVKQKLGENAKLCYVDTDRFIVDVKADDIYKGIAKDVEKRFDTSNCEIDRPLLQGKNEKVLD